MTRATPLSSDPDLVHRLRTAFDEAGYSSAHIAEQLDRDRAQLPFPAYEQLSRRHLGDDPLAVLIRLFTLRSAVPAIAVERSLGDVGLKGAVELGLVRQDGDLVEPLFIITAVEDMLVSGDIEPDPMRHLPDHVTAVSHTSAVCASLTVRQPAGLVFDLGTGSGVQALLAARHATKVVATDVNPRAIAFTQFNAVLNHITNIELRSGSLFAPVVGDRFDLIVSNAPYVVSPERKLAYRDAGMVGDDLTATVLRGLAEHLVPGGHATVTASWLERDSEPSNAKLAGWLGDSCNAIVLTNRSLDPVTHAVAWNLPLQQTAGAQFEASVDAWVAGATQLGAKLIHEGAVVVRRRAQPGGWVRVESLVPRSGGGGSDHLLAMFAAIDALEVLDDDALLALPIALTPRTVITEESASIEGVITMASARMSTSQGLPLAASIDARTASLVRSFDGRASLRQRLDEVAARTGIATDELSSLRAQVLPIVREMAANGFLDLGVSRDGDGLITRSRVAPLAPADAKVALQLRAALDRADYNAPAIAAALDTEEGQLTVVGDRPVYERRLETARHDLAALIRLFLLELPVEPDDASTVLGDELLDALLGRGLLHEAGGQIRGSVQLAPHGRLLVAADVASYGAPDVVTAVQRPTITLADLTVRRSVARALDIGTGNGFQAFLAAQHSTHVVATDVNPRALLMAGWGAALNGIENIELRLGNLFEPVDGEHFDLVVSNPPYVVSPEHRFLFRDGGLPADHLSEAVARGVPSLLADGGFASVMLSWSASDGALPEPLEWVSGMACDAVLLVASRQDPLGSAASWNRQLRNDPVRYGQAIDRWREYYDELGIQRLDYGALVLRRRAAEECWLTALPLPGRARLASDHLQRMFAGGDVLQRSSAVPDALGAERFRVTDDATVVSRFAAGDQGWRGVGSELQFTRGVGFELVLDDAAAALLARLDGATALTAAIAGLGGDVGGPQTLVDAAPLVERLLRMGILERAT